MASLFMSFTPTTTRTRVFAPTATKGTTSAPIKEEKGFLDWILGGMQKEDQFFETDPILKKVEEKSAGTTSNGRKNTVVVPPQKKKGGGFGGLFAK